MRALNQPVSWWGWHWSPPEPLSIVEILERGSMPPRLAALFWLGIDRGSSLLIAADPPLAGKTTVLTALLAFAPPEAVAYFTRGLGETFDLPPVSDSHPTYILVNEMSDHIPVYTWGRYARRAFELLAEGYSLATTMHANSVAEVMDILENDLSVPQRQIANLAFVAAMHVGYRGGVGRRRLSEVAFLRPGDQAGGEVRRSTVAAWNPEDDSFRVADSPEEVSALASWAGLSEEAFLGEWERREEFLRGLLREGVMELRAVQEALFAYYEGLRPEGRPQPPASGRSRERQARRRPPPTLGR